MTAPSRITFVTCLLAAPILFGVFTILFTFGGEYGGRFASVGRAGLLLTLPAWLTAFAWMAWRSANRGETGVKPYVFASLGANAASLVIYPALIFGANALGADLEGSLRDSVAQMQNTDSPATAQELTFTTAAFLSGVIVFFFGLFFMPILAATFGWVAGKLGLVTPPPV